MYTGDLQVNQATSLLYNIMVLNNPFSQVVTRSLDLNSLFELQPKKTHFENRKKNYSRNACGQWWNGFVKCSYL